MSTAPADAELTSAASAMDDRTIHAELDDEKVVRYDRAGKWWIEYEPVQLRPGRHIRIDHAALRAYQMEQEGGTIYLGKPGGSAFDRLVKKYRERYGRCPQGHPYDEVNTYFHPTTGRMCRICQREHKRAYKRRKRLEARGR
jgi:hypothetical protein